MRKLLAFITFAAASTTAAAAQPPLLIRHVAVIPMDRERVLTDRDVLISDGLIKAIAKGGSIAAPRGAGVVDGRGRFLLPGLVDFHTHPTSPDELVSYLAYGQTAIATLGGEGLALRKRPSLGPHLMSASFILDGNPPTNRRFFAVHDPGAADAVVRQMKARGADFLKVYGKMKAPELAALGVPARRQGLAIFGHLPSAVPIDQALDSINVVAHGEEYFGTLKDDTSDAALQRVARLTAEKHAAVIPNMVAYAEMPRQAAHLAEFMADRDFRYLPANTYQEWLPQNNRYATRPNIADFVETSNRRMAVLKRLTAALHREGVLLLAGTDAPVICLPGKCLLDDLRLLHEAGLSNYETLAAATTNAGQLWSTVMKRPGRFGMVEAKNRADLVLLRANPLQSLDALAALDGVVLGGRWLTKARIDAERERAARRTASKRALVDRYEQLLDAKDMDRLVRLVSSVRRNEDVFNLNAVIYDLLILENDGRRSDAIRLGRALLRPLGDNHGLWNVLGGLELASGQLDAAARSFRASLNLAPLNGVAIDGLRAALTPIRADAR